MDRETRLRKLTELQNQVFNKMTEAENEWLFQEAEELRDLYNEMESMDFNYTGQEEYDDLLERFQELN